MTSTVLPPASRNSACPCGSGRRYKECHGALGAAIASADPGTDRRNAILGGALAAQKAGDLVAAEAGYRTVLSELPEHFDALHMLGVVMLQENRLNEAEMLIARAVVLRPDIAAAQQNLAIVREAGAMVATEEAICRAVMPRLARLCLEPVPLPLADVGPGDAVHVLFAGNNADVSLAQRIASAATLRNAALTVGNLADPGPPGWLPFDEAQLDTLVGAAVVIVGLEVALGDWPLTAAPRSTTLVATRDAPCLLLDRVREASGQGRRRIALATADASVASAALLPMRVFASLEDM
jgi:hypothetical protein